MLLDCGGLDSDGDGVANSLDNCILTANETQDDGDGDGYGDACDFCPGNFDRGQADTDQDGVGDGCDSCPFLANTEQQDNDGDGSGDLCDPTPANSNQGVPSDAIELVLDHDSITEITTLGWQPEPHAVGYEVYRASENEARLRDYGACQNHRDPDTTDTSFDDDQTPSPGGFFGYLVVGTGYGGTRGLSGLDGSGHQRDLRAKDCVD